IREVALHALHRTAEEARQAARDEPDPFAALARTMHRSIDVRTAAVFAAVLGEIPFDDEEITRPRQPAPAAVHSLVAPAPRGAAPAVRRSPPRGPLRGHGHSHRAPAPPAARRVACRGPGPPDPPPPQPADRWAAHHRPAASRAGRPGTYPCRPAPVPPAADS